VGTGVGKQALIAEDDDQIRSLLALILQRDGYSVVQARNGQEAIDRLAEKPYDLLLLDLMMPVRSGFDVLLDIQQSGNKPAALIVVSAVPEPFLDRVKQQADRVVPKPFDLQELRKVIASVSASAA
jgi:CheY-like chemotaxis protein